jgi:hypothetical protein
LAQQVATNPRLIGDTLSALMNRGKRKATNSRPTAPALPPPPAANSAVGVTPRSLPASVPPSPPRPAPPAPPSPAPVVPAPPPPAPPTLTPVKDTP